MAMRSGEPGNGVLLFEARAVILYSTRAFGERLMFARARPGRFGCWPSTYPHHRLLRRSRLNQNGCAAHAGALSQLPVFQPHMLAKTLKFALTNTQAHPKGSLARSITRTVQAHNRHGIALTGGS